MFGPDLVVDVDDWVPSIFSTYHTSDAILGHILVSVEICRYSLLYMIIPIFEIHVKLMILFYLFIYYYYYF